MGLDAASYAEAGETLSIANSASLFTFLPPVFSAWPTGSQRKTMQRWPVGRHGWPVHSRGEGAQQRVTQTMMPLVEWRLLADLYESETALGEGQYSARPFCLGSHDCDAVRRLTCVTCPCRPGLPWDFPREKNVTLTHGIKGSQSASS